MREWLVVEKSWRNSIFAPDYARGPNYIPRDVAEKLLGRDLGGTTWFTDDESKQMRSHPEWRDTEPPEQSSPLGFWR